MDSLPKDVFRELLLIGGDDISIRLKLTTNEVSNKVNLIEAEELYWKDKLEQKLGLSLTERIVSWTDMYSKLKDLKESFTLADVATRGDYVEMIASLLGKGEDLDNLFKLAVEYGRLGIVKFLLVDGRVDPSIDDNYAIIEASEKGYTEIVKLLLADERVDPGVNYNRALTLASYEGHIDVVKLLLADKRVNPKSNNSAPIRWATDGGRIEVIRLLLADGRVDPSELNNYALKRARVAGHKDIVKLLQTDPRV